MAPLDLLEQQVKNAVRGRVHSAQAKVQRETSLVGLSRSYLGSLARKGKKKAASGRQPQPGVYSQKTLDGYLRRSPVQTIRTAPGYRAAMARRVVGAIIVVILLALAAAVLLRVL